MNPIAFLVVSTVAVIIGLPLLAITTYFVWVSWQTRPRRPKEDGYKYIYIEDDGSAREIAPDEIEYLETKFHPADGARPYIKLQYESLNGWGNLAGYLPRRQLPKNILIAHAPSKHFIERSNLKEALFEEHKLAGDTVIENPDGSFTIKHNKNISMKERYEIYKQIYFHKDDELNKTEGRTPKNAS